MRYFKDSEDGFYALSDGVEPPSNWQELSESSWDASNPQSYIDPKNAIIIKIQAMEREQLMPRATREFMLLFMETQATPDILAVNPGYQAVKAFDEQIKILRAQL